MRVLLLAAGLGTRMRPLTDKMPKCLLKIGEHSLIEHHLLRLAADDFQDIVINLAYRGEQIQQALGDGQNYGVNITYSHEAKPLETAGGIRYALDKLGPDHFIVINSDVWTDYPFAKLKQQTDYKMHLVMVPNPAQHPEGDFHLQQSFLNTTPPGPRYTFSGIGVYHPSLFLDIASGDSKRLRPVIEHAISQHQAHAELYHGDWQDIGTPERLECLRKFALAHKLLHKANF